MRVSWGIFFFLIWGTSALANEQAGFVGFGPTKVNTEASYINDTQDGTGLTVGWLTYLETNPIKLRTGASIRQRKYKLEAPTNTVEVDYLYLEAPVTAFYSLNESIAIYGGANVDILAHTSCDDTLNQCNDDGAKTMVFAAAAGAHFRAAPNFGIELDYAHGITPLISESGDDVSFGDLTIRLLYFF